MNKVFVFATIGVLGSASAEALAQQATILVDPEEKTWSLTGSISGTAAWYGSGYYGMYFETPNAMSQATAGGLSHYVDFVTDDTNDNFRSGRLSVGYNSSLYLSFVFYNDPGAMTITGLGHPKPYGFMPRAAIDIFESMDGVVLQPNDSSPGTPLRPASGFEGGWVVRVIPAPSTGCLLLVGGTVAIRRRRR